HEEALGKLGLVPALANCPARRKLPRPELLNEVKGVRTMQKTMSQTDSVNLTCLSKLMQNYQAEQPVSAAGALAATADADGNIVVFTVSTGGNIVCLRPGQGSGIGWSQTATGLQGSQIGVGLTESGALLVVTPDAEVITFVEQTASGWSSPR